MSPFEHHSPVSTAPDPAGDLAAEIRSCRLCAGRFAATVTGHTPRPVVWFHPAARVLIAGQAPGLRVHEAGRPFADRSGDRLRDWLGMDAATFYDRARIAIVPMAFCFPGYDAKGADLPPPPVCAQSWQGRVMAAMPALRLRLLVGGAAQHWHLGRRGVTQTVRDWRGVLAASGQNGAPRDFPLPHPSWRNTGWLKRNPWFEAEALPALRRELRPLLEG
ncbi:uracil-DNA glycosylase family protein [Thioclava sp. BHET1]|nr:uracil-DNA glycosylase family protein [Thioclava sp. BHET1]